MDDVLAWLLSDSLGREKLALLLLCTMVVYVVATHLTWRLGCGGTGHRIVVSVGRSWLGRWFAQILRLFYYAGAPFAVLWRGELVREMGIPTTYAGNRDGDAILHVLGLAEAQDVMHLGTGLAIGIGALCLLVVVWVWYVRTAFAFQRPCPDWSSPAVAWWETLREAVFFQAFWALYRGVVTMWTTDRLHAAFVSLALITVSWVLSPQRRHQLRDESRAYLVVQDWMFALFTAFASLTVQSLWLLVLLHALWMWVSGRILDHLLRAHLIIALGSE